MSTKRRRIVYSSQGTDGIKIACESVADAVSHFRADCEALLGDSEIRFDTIDLSTIDMSDDVFESLREI